MVEIHWKLEFVIFVMIGCRAPGQELGVRVSAFAFSRRFRVFKLTVDISMCKTILEVEYFKSMIYQKLIFLKKEKLIFTFC